MHSLIRLKLDMAGRAAEFCRNHPDDNPATAQVATRLTELIDRAETLARQQRSSLTVASAAVNAKAELRLAIENGLAALFGIAKVASVAHPDIAVHRRLPRAHANEVTLLTSARVAVAEATAIKEQLAPYGLNDGLLETLAADIDAYNVELGRQRTAITAQVGAGADLKAVSTDIMAVVKNLDALHRVRFRNDRELRAAWKSARNVAWQLREPVGPATPTTPAPDQASAA